MSFLYLFLSFIPLALVIGAIFGWVSFIKTRELEERVNSLQRQLWQMRQQAGEVPEQTSVESSQKAAAAPPRSSEVASAQEQREPLAKPATAQRSPSQKATPATATPKHQGPSLWQRLRDSWMIWLGGASIGLAGIFMVRYSIEQGLLGPTGRIVLAVVTGLLFHAAAEWLRRTRGEQAAFAALAGGASITLYAALLAALHLYQLLSPGLVFVLLALVSLATMALALLHGPVLAIIGILGAYVVPILVSTGSGNIVAALIYSLIISGAALLLMRYVYRPWLWLGMLVGALGWAALSLANAEAHVFRGYYLAILTYLILALPRSDWWLREAQLLPDTGGSWLRRVLAGEYQALQIALGLMVGLMGLSLLAQPFDSAGFSAHLPFIAVLFLAARFRESIQPLPWLALVVQWLACLAPVWSGSGQLQFVLIEPAETSRFVGWVSATAGLYSLLALWNLGLGRFKHLWASLMCLAPPVWLALLYLRVPAVVNSEYWALASLMLGATYAFIAGKRLLRRDSDATALWLLLGGHGAYSLAVAILFEEAGLTLALALQLLSLAWLMRRFQMPALGWLMKLVIAVVVARLTLNPWLLTYPSDVHWSLWTYGGATLCCWLASYCLPAEDELKRWLQAAGIHLLVLTLGAETRYWLYDGQVFGQRYGFTEAAINTNLWAAMALTYFYRARVTRFMQVIYVPAARILMALALASYGLLLTVHNPYWATVVLSERPVLNGLLLAYGLPVVMAGLAFRYYEPPFRRLAAVVAGVGLFVFVNVEIRHLWNGAVAEYLPTSNGELYTYSLVWLVMAVVTILLGTQRALPAVYKAGMALLLLVIAKIFLVDMSDLEGLLRVASFMVLGLGLLGLSYLYQRLTAAMAQRGE